MIDSSLFLQIYGHPFMLNLKRCYTGLQTSLFGYIHELFKY